MGAERGGGRGWLCRRRKGPRAKGCGRLGLLEESRRQIRSKSLQKEGNPADSF